MRPFYRVQQFTRAVYPSLGSDDYAMVESVLSPGEIKLFSEMTPGMQKHGLNVFKYLREKGQNDNDLLKGALIHDIGKGKMGLFCRILVVLMEAFCPAWIRKMASENQSSWRNELYLHLNHAELGAEMARVAGSSGRVVGLIRNHHRRYSIDPLVQILRIADEAN